MLDDLPLEDNFKPPIARALFQAGLLILRLWKAVDPPTLKEWITRVGDTLRLELFPSIEDALENLMHYGHPGWIPWDFPR